MRNERFEFITDRRGPMAQLQWERFTITLTEWPASLLSMLRNDMLGKNARAEAEAL